LLFLRLLAAPRVLIMVRVVQLLALAALSLAPVNGIELDVNSVGKASSLQWMSMLTSPDSIKSAASSLASQLVGYYTANSTGRENGTLPSPYSWWEAGALFDTLIQYSHLTGDTQYNSLVSTGLLSQVGKNSDFMPVNQSATEGNDGQATWALAAMSAAEAQFTNGTQWLALADTVFNILVQRWDSATCSGGLRWQIYSFAQGFYYKNSASNGHFFQLASRLARYTGNATYSTWANTAYDWTKSTGFIDSKFNVYDGAPIVLNNCTDVSKVQYSYVAGTYITGVAHMYNITNGNSKWKTELDGLLNQTLSVFFGNKAATEVVCEKSDTCTVDMMAMKGLLGHWLADAVQMAPYTANTVLPLLASSAQAAANACDGTGCSLFWDGKHMGIDGNGTGVVGPSIDALSFVQGLLWQEAGLTGLPATVNGTAVAANSTSTASGAVASSTKKSDGVAMRAGVVLLVSVLGSMMWFVL
jgi:mannan endo-1,6-alpha-mannosidase